MNDKNIISVLRELSTFRPFQRFSFQLPLPQYSLTGSLLLGKKYGNDYLSKVIQISSQKLLKSLH